MASPGSSDSSCVDFHGLPGLPLEMMTVFQKQPFQGSPVEVTLPWTLPQRHMCSASVLSLSIFKERRYTLHSSMKKQSKTCCKKNVWGGRQCCFRKNMICHVLHLRHDVLGVKGLVLTFSQCWEVPKNTSVTDTMSSVLHWASQQINTNGWELLIWRSRFLE